VRRIWKGEELFDHMDEAAPVREYILRNTPRLFKLYEQVLNNVCRDTNLEKARTDPTDWLVPGSLEFIGFLHHSGVKNYLVTGAVIEQEENGKLVETGMYEEVLALGFDIGPGREIEGLYGSSWNEKVPKREVIKKLSAEMNFASENIMVVGDGRAEIEVGVEIKAVTMSRIPEGAARDREIHMALGTNYMLTDYTSPELYKLITAAEQA
jgi:hypothetical protein